MSFKDFAINYLNPFYLFQRFWLLVAAGGCISLSMGPFSDVQSKLALIVFVAIGVTVAIRRGLRNYPILANIMTPFFMVCGGFALLASQPSGEFQKILASCVLWSAAFLLTWNALRPWGGGVSMHDMNQKMKSLGK